MKSWHLLQRHADEILAEPMEIPPRGGNWEQFYISPVTGNNLSIGKLVGDFRWEHIDKSTGQAFLGDTTDLEKDFDGVVISLIHDTWAIGALQLGLAYQISGDTAYSVKARSILLAYADLYPKLPVRNRKTGKLPANGMGKIHVQGLNEAQWLLDMAEAT